MKRILITMLIFACSTPRLFAKERPADQSHILVDCEYTIRSGDTLMIDITPPEYAQPGLKGPYCYLVGKIKCESHDITVYIGKQVWENEIDYEGKIDPFLFYADRQSEMTIGVPFYDPNSYEGGLYNIFVVLDNTYSKITDKTVYVFLALVIHY
jgi:hypothetical protein